MRAHSWVASDIGGDCGRDGHCGASRGGRVDGLMGSESLNASCPGLRGHRVANRRPHGTVVRAAAGVTGAPYGGVRKVRHPDEGVNSSLLCVRTLCHEIPRKLGMTH